MNQAAEEVRARLFALQDKEYQAFNAKLLPTIPPERIIGVRMPLTRQWPLWSGSCPTWTTGPPATC